MDIKINTLLIVGYANVLTKDNLPTVVAPVFRAIENRTAFYFPPFKVVGNTVLNATIADEHEFNKLVEQEEITPIPKPIKAKSNSELWIDENGCAHYGYNIDVATELNALSLKYIDQMEKFFLENELQHADKLANQAISANDSQSKPWALKIAIRKHKGKESAAFFCDVAYSQFSKKEVDVLVDSYLSQLNASGTKTFLSVMNQLRTKLNQVIRENNKTLEPIISLLQKVEFGELCGGFRGTKDPSINFVQSINIERNEVHSISLNLPEVDMQYNHLFFYRKNKNDVVLYYQNGEMPDSQQIRVDIEFRKEDKGENTILLLATKNELSLDPKQFIQQSIIKDISYFEKIIQETCDNDGYPLWLGNVYVG